MRDEKCETCRWWGHPFKESDDRQEGIIGTAPCQRFPPHPFRNLSGYGTSWPKTKPIDYCGEHSPKDSPHD